MGSPWRFRAVVCAALLVALLLSSSAQAALSFVFNKASARPGMTVLAYQPPAYTPSPKGIVVYLIPTRLPGVRPNSGGGYVLFHPPTRHVVRLGNARYVSGGRIGVRFRVPAVTPGNYTIGLWCSTCYHGRGDFISSALWGEAWTGVAGNVLRITRWRSPWRISRPTRVGATKLGDRSVKKSWDYGSRVCRWPDLAVDSLSTSCARSTKSGWQS